MTLPTQEADALQRARRAGLYLLSLVNSMIDLSQLESRTLAIRATRSDLFEEMEVVRTREEMKYKERVAVQKEILRKRLEADEADKWRETAGKVAIAALPLVWAGGTDVWTAQNWLFDGVGTPTLATGSENMVVDSGTVNATGATNAGLSLSIALDLPGGTVINERARFGARSQAHPHLPGEIGHRPRIRPPLRHLPKDDPGGDQSDRKENHPKQARRSCCIHDCLDCQVVQIIFKVERLSLPGSWH